MTIISTANKSEEELQRLLFKPIEGKLSECYLPCPSPSEAKIQIQKWEALEESLETVFHSIFNLPLKPEDYSVKSEYEQASKTRDQFTDLISSMKPYIEEHLLHLERIIKTSSNAT